MEISLKHDFLRSVSSGVSQVSNEVWFCSLAVHQSSSPLPTLRPSKKGKHFLKNRKDRENQKSIKNLLPCVMNSDLKKKHEEEK